MLETTAREIAEITGGRLVGGATDDERVTGDARIDSRSVATGDLFAAFVGERADGHDYLEAAREGGAVLSLVSREAQMPGVLVEDVGRRSEERRVGEEGRRRGAAARARRKAEEA